MAELDHPEFRRLSADAVEDLTEFLTQLRKRGEDAFFHPHPLTREAAQDVCTNVGLDLYYALMGRRGIHAYGMLRGWDDGFDVPSLGLAVAPEFRGTSVSRACLEMLHVAAFVRGAKSIRLKTYPQNTKALALFRSAGYIFDGTIESGQLVGFRDVARNASEAAP